MRVKEIEVMVLPDGRMDTKNAATYIGLSEKTLASMRSQGKGPKYLKRGRIFYRITDIEEWMGVAERVSTSQNNISDAVVGRSASACNTRRSHST